MTAYKPWKGFTLWGAFIALDIALQFHFGRGQGIAGLPTAIGMFIAWGWAVA